MRIAIPVTGDYVCSSLSESEAFHFYEDDHGKVVKQYLLPLKEHNAEAAVSLLEDNGIDALVCNHLSVDELRPVMLSGILFFIGYEGKADEAVLSYLTKAIAFDPNNTCNACGHGNACSMNCDSCTIKFG